MQKYNRGQQKYVTVEKMLRRRAFNKGYNDILRGKPWDGDRYECARDCGNYERGRHFGAIYRKPIKVDGRISSEAVATFFDAIKSKAII